MNEADEKEECFICKKRTDEPLSTLHEKGALSLNDARRQRGSLIDKFMVDQRIHHSCRREFCNLKKIELFKEKRKCDFLSKVAKYRQRLRSEDKNRFDFRSNCFLCGCIIDQTPGHESRNPFFSVRTDNFESSIKEKCEIRGDEWAIEVFGRISSVSDLHAADAIYHQQCSVDFRTGRHRREHQSEGPGKPVKRKSGAGRKEDEDRREAFLKAMEFFQANDDEQITVMNLVDYMRDECGVEPYSTKYMKEKMVAHFSNRIQFIRIGTQQEVVTQTTTATQIITEFFKERSKATEGDQVESEESKEISIVKTAARLLMAKIKDIPFNLEEYELHESLSSLNSLLEFLPPLIKIFLNEVVVGKEKDKKIAGIGHALVQAARPRAIRAPLQLGLAIQLHHQFSSAFLIDILNHFGLCSSYSEVLKFEKNAAITSKADLEGVIPPGAFLQYVADNADHNTCTIDGKGTFHGMGSIVAITPAVLSRRMVIKRRSVTANDIKEAGSIPILHCPPAKGSSLQLFFDSFKLPDVSDSGKLLDILWLSAGRLRENRPTWNTTMNAAMTGYHQGKGSVIFLPFIDLPASNESCIYSLMSFVSKQALNYGYDPVLTFDQPLYWKARKMIQQADPNDPVSRIVLKIGGFHTIMSFLGAIGHLMDGSGLSDLLSQIYATDTVPHLLSGKAISRAVRGHMLVDSALHAVLFSHLFADESHISESDQSELKALLESLLSPSSYNYGPIWNDSPALLKLNEAYENLRLSLSSFETARLWMMYSDMCAILRAFIRAERTGNWFLHLKTTAEMLPYLAAAGHNNYTKSCHVYLQDMGSLGETHPEVKRSFEEGLHVYRRRDSFWAGLSADLVIEQDLMRSMKSSTGFTRRRGITEIQRLTWIMSRPICSFINSLIQSLAEVGFETSEQHIKEDGKSRTERDNVDISILIRYLEESSPFEGDPTLLRSLSTGLTASKSCNVQNSKDVGMKILKSMAGASVETYIFRQKDHAILMTAKNEATDTSRSLDPSLLFQRLLIIAKGSNINEVEAFKHELCSYPAALFDAENCLKSPDKPELAKAIASVCNYDPSTADGAPSGGLYVLDGGALLHRIPWSKGETYASIYDRYFKYVSDHYPPGSTVVFDGYDDGPSTKDMVHLKRTRMQGRKVIFNQDMKLVMKKEEFLACKSNKSRFIKALGCHLEKNYNIVHADGDADLLIAQTAIKLSLDSVVSVIGDDTDLLILLIHHIKEESHHIFYCNEPKSGKGGKVWNIRALKEGLGPQVSRSILFIHAISGCDTVSRLHGVGKGKALKKIALGDSSFIRASEVFYKCDATHDEIAHAGETAILALYGSISKDLNTARFEAFNKKISVAKSFVHPQDIPPTTAASKFHSYRTFMQIQHWLGVPNNEPLSSNDWGWIEREGTLYPLMTDLAPAPESILVMLKCGCKGRCNTMRCSCRKNGISCSPACGNCKGITCDNCVNEPIDDEEFLI